MQSRISRRTAVPVSGWHLGPSTLSAASNVEGATRSVCRKTRAASAMLRPTGLGRRDGGGCIVGAERGRRGFVHYMRVSGALLRNAGGREAYLGRRRE